jgi:hypothetical protein
MNGESKSNEGGNKPIESILFPAGVDFSTESRSQLLEQYKLLVQTSESLVSRRQGVNTFFLTFNSLMLSGIGLFAKQELSGELGGIGLLALALSGLIICMAWIKLVRSYRQLNGGKFDIINRIEQHLPAAMFQAEWHSLAEGKDDKRYRPFTKTEERIPVVFGILYGAAAIFGALAILGIKVA